LFFQLKVTIQHQHGKKGEDLATAYLQSKGWEILARNWRYKRSEIDLIARDGQILVFVEVKTKSYTRFGEPETSVDDRKAAKIMEGAEQYVFDNDWHGDIRFDVVAITLQPQVDLLHLEDAFH
jgi:putative endonuclease